MQGASKQNCCTGGASPVAVCCVTPSMSEVYTFWTLHCTVGGVYVYPWPCDPQCSEAARERAREPWDADAGRVSGEIRNADSSR